MRRLLIFLLLSVTAAAQTVPTAVGNYPLTTAGISKMLDQITTTRGAIIYRGAAGWSVLAPGTSGYVLTSNGAGADPIYQAAPGGGSSNTVIGSATGINGLATGATTLYTVPAGKTFLLISGYAVVTALTGSVTTHAATRIIESSASGIMGSSVTQSSEAVNKVYVMAAATGSFAAAGTNVQLSITTAAVGPTTFTLSAYVIGFLY